MLTPGWGARAERNAETGLSGSRWLDLAVLVLALLAATSGWRHGAVASALAFLGVILGAIAGIMLAPRLIADLDDARIRVLIGIGLIVALVVIGEVAGMVLGRALRGGITSRAALSVDSTIGALLHAAAVLVAAWLLALPLTSSSQPTIAAAVRGSTVLSTVNELVPPWVQNVPAEFASLLNTSGLPNVIGPFGRTPLAEVDPPDDSILYSGVAQQVRPSVLRIRGTAESCQKALEGSGFVIAPQRVLTNAHVVAGTSSVLVDSGDTSLAATVVLYDPSVDIAILDVPGLAAPALSFTDESVDPGTNAMVVGYPGGGEYTASAARVREELMLRGPDIYQSAEVERQVYTVRGAIRQGNSGGPLVDAQGRVIGVVFGAAVDNDDTGFALTGTEVADQLARGSVAFESVSTGACAL